MLDQEPIEIEKFQGIFQNFDSESVPQGHFRDCLNHLFLPAGPYRLRDGINSFLARANIVRIRRYEIPNANDRILILDSNGDIYDSFTNVTPILSIPSMTDFAMVSLYGRAYISPNNGEEGLQDTPIYVYDPAKSSTARIAGGDPPAGFTLGATSIVAGALNVSIVAITTPINGVFTLTSSPFTPATPTPVRFTWTHGTGVVTSFTVTIVGLDASGAAQTGTYVSKVLSAGPLTFATSEVWSKITSITGSGLVGAVGTDKIAIRTVGGDGKVETGYHIIALAYETDSGFITPPGPVAGTQVEFKVLYVAAARREISVTGIPTVVPAGVTKIHVLVTKSINYFTYSGNPNNYELFFVPTTSGGEVPVGNTSTIINFFNADLLDSADFLKDNLAEIPAGVALLATSKGRLISIGVNNTSIVGGAVANNAGGKDVKANNTVLWVSKGGEPEAVSKTDGFVIVKPGGEGLRNAAEYRDLIYCYKKSRTYVTQDNGDLPSTWQLNSIDSSTGTECNGVGISLGSDSSVQDALIIASRTGLELFNGVYADRALSWKINGLWNTIDQASFNKIQVALDPSNKLIYVIAITTENPKVGSGWEMFVCDYNDGLDWQNVKWTRWNLTNGALPVKAILTQIGDAGVRLLLGTTTALYEWEYGSGLQDDLGVVISNLAEFYRCSFSPRGGVSQFRGYRIRIQGDGLVQSNLLGPNDVDVDVTDNTTITSASVNNILVEKNFVADSASLKLVVSAAIGVAINYIVSRVWFYGQEIWSERPQ